jgi:hypothetical protein
MAHGWAQAEAEDVDLGDERLNERLVEVLSQLGQHPTMSIPAACGGYAETAAAYRFFDNSKATFPAVLAGHVCATRRRMAGEPVVVLAQDTSELDVTRPEQQIVGAGPLDSGARRGVLLHPLVAFTPDGVPLGTVHAEVLIRADAPPGEKPVRKATAAAQRKQTPIEDKESQRWITGLRQAHEEARLAPQTHIVHVADSEADIYELLAEAQTGPGNFDWIVRACQNRAVRGGDSDAAAAPVDETVAGLLREQLAAREVLFTHTIHVRGRSAKVTCEDRGRRQPRQSHTAQVEVRAARVTLRPPWRPDRKLPDVSVNVVWVREIDPPAGEPAVEWMLLTSLPITTVEQVRQIIQYYCTRWMIEVFFRTLKSGCKVERRRFEHVERLLPCVAIYLIVTWRTLFVCRMGRAVPDASCEVIFEPAEWKSLYQAVRRQPPPKAPPNLQTMVRMVAQLGGYVNRQRDDEPGPQTVWLGLQRLHDITWCWNAFGPEARTEVALV